MVLTHIPTIAYGGFLALGGFVGFLASGSITSLLFGGACGAALVALGLLSMKDYEENAKQNMFKSATYSYCVAAFVISLLVTLVMGDRYYETGKVMPPGVIALVSLGMMAFYAYKLSSDDVGTHAKRARY